MNRLTNDQKAALYNQHLFHYQKIQEQIRQIRAENINLSESDERKIRLLEIEAKKIYESTARLYR